MKRSNALIPVTAGVLACVWAISLSLPAANEASAAPVIVVVAPWSDAPETIVEKAGGAIVGPARAPFAIVAANASRSEFLDAGAWAVLSANAFQYLCGPSAVEPNI